MRSAVVAKSLTDLTRRRARTAFAVASLSLAVARRGVFAVEPMMDDVMQEEVASTRLADLTVETRPLPLDRANLAGLERIPNVAAVEPRSVFATRVYAGERREDALLVGIDDYKRQQVNVVHVVSGTAPRGAGTVLGACRAAR